MKKIIVAGFLLAGIMGANAQTIQIQGSTLTSPAGGAGSIFIGSQVGNTGATGGSNVFIGNGNGRVNTSGTQNVFTGYGTGEKNLGGSSNVFNGAQAGYNNLNGSANVFNGLGAGYSNTGGNYNIFTGYQSGYLNTGGWYNVFTGFQAGYNTTSDNNVFTGSMAGYTNTTGNGNIFTGYQAGYKNSTGSNNVFIGNSAGYNELGSNKLYIANTNTAVPLIWGDFGTSGQNNSQLKLNGKVGIGAVTTFPTLPIYSTYKLFVTGGILSDEVRVVSSASGTWADYVFAKNYTLKPLAEVEQFITANGHLPNVPSAAQVKEEGIALGDMTRIQQEKIEELTLYLIQQNKEIELLKTQVKTLLEVRK